ncbi:hypothetical protein [Stappia sp.]|jgi:hypothetical protein|uniref:hypothetical protein n=1 Tax=Stappia sp. TaxID=1870903 RepID=UPI003D152E4B
MAGSILSVLTGITCKAKLASEGLQRAGRTGKHLRERNARADRAQAARGGVADRGHGLPIRGDRAQCFEL